MFSKIKTSNKEQYDILIEEIRNELHAHLLGTSIHSQMMNFDQFGSMVRALQILEKGVKLTSKVVQKPEKRMKNV